MMIVRKILSNFAKNLGALGGLEYLGMPRIPRMPRKNKNIK